jgi:hypothetical protein
VTSSEHAVSQANIAWPSRGWVELGVCPIRWAPLPSASHGGERLGDARIVTIVAGVEVSERLPIGINDFDGPLVDAHGSGFLVVKEEATALTGRCSP